MKLNEKKPLIIAHDAKTNRNVDAVLAFYDEKIKKKDIQATQIRLLLYYL